MHNSHHSFSTTPLLNKYLNTRKCGVCPFICSEALEKPMCGWINNTPHRICDIWGYGKTVMSVVALPAHIWNFPDFGTGISETLSLMLCRCLLAAPQSYKMFSLTQHSLGYWTSFITFITMSKNRKGKHWALAIWFVLLVLIHIIAVITITYVKIKGWIAT